KFRKRIVTHSASNKCRVFGIHKIPSKVNLCEHNSLLTRASALVRNKRKMSQPREDLKEIKRIKIHDLRSRDKNKTNEEPQTDNENQKMIELALTGKQTNNKLNTNSTDWSEDLEQNYHEEEILQELLNTEKTIVDNNENPENSIETEVEGSENSLEKNSGDRQNSCIQHSNELEIAVHKISEKGRTKPNTKSYNKNLKLEIMQTNEDNLYLNEININTNIEFYSNIQKDKRRENETQEDRTSEDKNQEDEYYTQRRSSSITKYAHHE
ncbi:10933_t:CDS:2, partial [Scutellospora calospora]